MHPPSYGHKHAGHCPHGGSHEVVSPQEMQDYHSEELFVHQHSEHTLALRCAGRPSPNYAFRPWHASPWVSCLAALVGQTWIQPCLRQSCVAESWEPVRLPDQFVAGLNLLPQVLVRLRAAVGVELRCT